MEFHSFYRKLFLFEHFIFFTFIYNLQCQRRFLHRNKHAHKRENENRERERERGMGRVVKIGGWRNAHLHSSRRWCRWSIKCICAPYYDANTIRVACNVVSYDSWIHRTLNNCTFWTFFSKCSVQVHSFISFESRIENCKMICWFDV